ncbi:hypothetical protein B296_00010937 [Ensete ventricosum]|uniref:Uncharacterized protein n=1 Tax=Ensete ventricosum TaxID=4639 RepID=A0A427AK31_ENSVE|nr:hypothetical protein B296_00010937 [Ensete ventricosum]
MKEKSVLYISETKKKRKANKKLTKGKGKERPGKVKVLARPKKLTRGEMDLKDTRSVDRMKDDNDGNDGDDDMDDERQ